MIKPVKLTSKHLPLLALALLVSSSRLKAEESQLPIKVGDVVRLSFPDIKDRGVFIVKQVKGRWIAAEGSDIIGKKGEIYRWDQWINTDYCDAVEVNSPEELDLFGLTQPPPKPPTFTYSVVDGKTVVTTNSQTTNAPTQVPSRVEANTNSPRMNRGLNKGKPYPIPNKKTLQIVTPPLPDLPAPEKNTEKDASKVEEDPK